jgi:asparagine synthase (glutamine-hydrolysing)
MSYGGASKLLRSLDPRVPTRIRSIDHLDDLLAASVRGRLDADVSLGCFLSGGIDSSLIAHYALRERGALTTLTVRMPDARYDESPHAERVAAHLGTNHIVLDCDAESAAEDLVLIIETLGLPFGDSSILPTYWLCRAAREMVKVALAGDGGDELFYGYDRYGASRYIWLGGLVYPSWLRRTDPRSKSERLARLAIAARSSNRYWELLAIFQRPDRRALFGKAKGCLCADPFLPQHTEPRMVDLGTYLPCDLLRKVDTASLMNGLEVRCPMLAKALAEAAYVTSRRSLTRGGPKGMLRELARKHLPREVADRPKQGFSIPISNWWRTNFGGLRDLLLDVLAGERPFGRVHDVLEINMDFVRRMLDEHWAAGGLTPMHTSRHVRPRDHGQRLFALVSLAIWSRTIR